MSIPSQSPSPATEYTPRDILLNNAAFLTFAFSVSVFGLIYFIINVFVIGGDRFVMGLSDFLALVAAVSATTFAILLWNRLKADPSSNQIWGAISIGLGLWTLTQLFWFFTAIIDRGNVVFSVGYLFWILAYPPIFYGLFNRYRAMQASLPRKQWWKVFVTLLPAVLLTISGAAHILRTSRDAEWFASLFSLLLSIADIGLLGLAILIFFSFEGHGSFRTPWRVIGIAFLLRTFGNLAYTYAVLRGLYAPNGQVNFLTGFSNFSYAYWYLLFTFGLFIYQVLLDFEIKGPKSLTPAQPSASPNARVLIFNDEKDNVIKASLNYSLAMHLPNQTQVIGAPLHTILGITDQVYSEMKDNLKKTGVYTNVVPSSYLGKNQRVWISAIRSENVLKQYNGANIVLRVFAEARAATVLTSEENALAESILSNTGSQGADTEHLLLNYFSAHYKLLHGLATQFSGARIARALTEVINETANRNRWSMRIENQVLMVTGNMKTQEIGKALAVLIKAGRGYVSSNIGPEVVRRECDKLDQQMDKSTKTLMDMFRLSGM